jgi:hypothetical protein
MALVIPALKPEHEHVKYMLRCLHVVICSGLQRKVDCDMYPMYSAAAHQYMAVRTKSPYWGPTKMKYATQVGALSCSPAELPAPC